MTIATERNSRRAQGQYYERAAQGEEEEVVTTRDHGDSKLAPVTSDDTLMSRSAFLEKIRLSEKEILDGEGKSFATAEEALAYFRTL